jgi:hypothetical protein
VRNALPVSVSDPTLAALITRWPDLPPAIRAGIAAMVEASVSDAAGPRGGGA